MQLGDIVSAEVIQTSGDTCFLRLRSDKGATALGRLKQTDSLAWRDSRTLEKLPAYGTSQLLRVMLKHQRRDGGRVVWFTHERWAHHNPWTALLKGDSLREGDRITGRVTRIAHRADETLLGYIVQLEIDKPICDEQGLPWAQELDDGTHQDLLQPDMEVFLPVDELPANQEGSRLGLEAGEQVTALVISATRLQPHHPLVSIERLRAAAEADFWDDASSRHDTALKAAFESAPRRFAPLKVAQAEPIDPLPWANRRIALVDDQPSAAEALAASLTHRGAHVTLWLPKDDQKGWRENELQDSLREALTSDAELLLVDDGMPQPHRGEDALFKALKSVQEDGLLVKPRVWLMSAQTPDTARPHGDLQALGIRGTLRRPLSPQLVQTLLEQPSHEAWHWHNEDRPDVQVVSLNTPRALDQLLRFAQRALGQDYAVLLAEGPGGRLIWLASAGRVPFDPTQLAELVAETELRLLIQGKQAQLTLARRSTVNLIHPQAGHVGRWQALGSSGSTPEYLLGVGSQRGQDCGASWPWLVYAARAELRAQQLSTLFQNNTAALSAGWLAEGYAHETVHDRQDLLAVVDALQTLCGQAQAQGTGIAPERVRDLAQNLQRVVQAQNAKAQSLLRRHRQRSAPLHLRAWVADVGPLLAKQCSEWGCAFRLGDNVPDLVLPMPEWLLTLCVVNLVLNGAKHQTNQDAAWVRLDFALQTEADAQTLCVRVQDNGWGLTPDALAHLFSPGVSEAPVPEARHGIGLWLSQTLVREAGGSLRLAWSYRGYGACFELSIPVTLG